MRLGSVRLAVFLILGLTTVSAYSQNLDEQNPESDIDVVNQAELDAQRLVSREFFREAHLAISINRKLTGILQRNPASLLRPRIEAVLIPIQEFLAGRDLEIANFYLNREHGGTRGAEARLLRVLKDFPNFSRMDEVLFRLSTASLRDARTADGRTYLRKLICRYPASAQVGPAFERLNEIGFGDWEGCDKLKQ